jgi:hypothetical protein
MYPSILDAPHEPLTLERLRPMVELHIHGIDRLNDEIVTRRVVEIHLQVAFRGFRIAPLPTAQHMASVEVDLFSPPLLVGRAQHGNS